MDDYDVYIDDLFVEDNPITKEKMIKILNKEIRAKSSLVDNDKGIELDVLPEWEKILLEDGSILRSYEKLGWRVMWYKQGYRTKPTRSWLSFRNTQNKGDK